MKIPSGPWPPALLAPPAPAPLPAPGSGELPGLFPSGEIATRAERFPAGIAGGGAAGPGVAESAMIVSVSPVRPAISGAAAFISPFRGAERGADMGFTGSSGLAGTRADEAMLIAPAAFSRTEISGAAAFEADSDAGAFGRSEVSSFAVSCSFGRSGCAFASCTMFGSAGRILGGSCGAFGWISVCRGCVGCSGSESIVCLGWNASAPRAGYFAICSRPGGRGAWMAGSIAGKSLAGPYHVISSWETAAAGRAG